jgi:hypothetical protein
MKILKISFQIFLIIVGGICITILSYPHPVATAIVSGLFGTLLADLKWRM